jgi:UPF0755 protein
MRALWFTLCIGALACAYLFLVSPVQDISEAVLKVHSGESVTNVSEELLERKVVRSAFVFKVFASLFGGVQAGWYDVSVPQNAVLLAWRMARGDTGLTPRRVTIPEGATVREISGLLGIEVPSKEEGYLFPDTYYFLPGTPVEQIVARMHERYEEVIDPLRPEIKESGHTEHDILVMASLLEKEGRLPETRRMIAGILWKRLTLGMPLQVDAVFGYIKGTATYSPTLDDLKIDSPYNTYLYTGLPPGPINNPGLEALKAALEPTKSPYLYYLTGKDGTMHYARTFDEHIANKRFLR